MQSLFEAIGRKTYDIKGHTGYAVKFSEFKKIPIKKWSGNRDPDMGRVNEMVELYKKCNMGYFPLQLHLAVLDDEGIVCYDGNHRRETLNRLELPDELNISIDIMFHANRSAVYKAFENINKAVSVPAIYFEEEDNTSYRIRDEINKLAREFESKYKDHVSPSSRFRKPNFNRDVLSDNIFQIYNDLNRTVSIREIGMYLDRLNTEYSNGNLCKPHSNYSSPIIDKCRKNNCWLFLERTIPTEHLQQLIEY